MANPTWPSSLPQYVFVQGFEEGGPDNVLHSAMDAGPPKTRRRFTAAYRPLDVIVALDASQAATFVTFVNTTLKDGSLPFDWVHPRTQAAATLKFRGPYAIRPETGGKTWLATLNLWVLP